MSNALPPPPGRSVPSPDEDQEGWQGTTHAQSQGVPEELLAFFRSDDPARDSELFWTTLASWFHEAESDQWHASWQGFVFPENADFTNATLIGDADFTGATFTGDANFAGATFTGDANFGGDTLLGEVPATFMGDAKFNAATFTGNANFSDATFPGDAFFDGATFTGEARFIGATFTGTNRDRPGAYFTDATFKGDARFMDATFAGVVFFTNATFTGDADFVRASFAGDAFFGATHHIHRPDLLRWCNLRQEGRIRRTHVVQ
jgi:hypothetical protein